MWCGTQRVSALGVSRIVGSLMRRGERECGRVWYAAYSRLRICKKHRILGSVRTTLSKYWLLGYHICLLSVQNLLSNALLFQSCASFIQISDGRTPISKSPPKNQYDPIDEHAALIGLQALTLNLETANRESDPIKPKKKCLKPLKISTSRKTPEKHVSIR